MKSTRTIALACAIVFLAVTTAILLSRRKAVWVLPPVDPEKGAAAYDWAGSRRNLEKIGAALQLYRQEYGFKPVAERKSRADAGLPTALAWTFGRAQGKPWFVPKRYWFPTNSRYEGNQPTEGPGFHLASFYIYSAGSTERHLRPDEAERFWALRGEEIPVLLDLNMYTGHETTGATRPLRVLVLRLNGRVEETLLQYGDNRDFLLNR